MKGRHPAPPVVEEKPRKERSPLAPVRHPNMDFFICDVLDAVPKDDMGSMEHPMFTLATKPDHRVFRYEHRGNRIEIAPSGYGLATIFDKDILIYCISQLVAKANEGIPITRTLRLTAYDLLVATNRNTSGDDYNRFEKSLNRLRGTSITTDVTSGGVRIREGFGLIDSWGIIEKNPNNARMVAIEITMSKWLFAAVKAGEVLTLDRAYFRIRKPLERRLYELARKHCGRQSSWRVSLEVLYTKTGSSSPLKKFRLMLRGVAKTNHLPGYRVVLAEDGNTVTFYNRESKGRIVQLKDLMKGLPGS
jgi:plasmid replication initiation protein